MTRKPEAPDQPLRRGWTTGACATAATKAALTALLTGDFADPVTITLPKGEQPGFALARQERLADGGRMASVIKDAGDDPDVTHLAEIRSTVRRLPPGSGIVFKAGPGVGTVTRPGLPLAVGEPAINPVPRRLMSDVVTELTAAVKNLIRAVEQGTKENKLNSAEKRAVQRLLETVLGRKPTSAELESILN